MPTVPKGDAVAFFPSGGEASGFRLPERAAIIPRRSEPHPQDEKALVQRRGAKGRRYLTARVLRTP